VLEYYPDDTVLVRSAHASHLVPAVMRVRVYVQRDWKHAKVSLSRRNVMLRDRFCCQCVAAPVPCTVTVVGHMSIAILLLLQYAAWRALPFEITLSLA